MTHLAHVTVSIGDAVKGAGFRSHHDNVQRPASWKRVATGRSGATSNRPRITGIIAAPFKPPYTIIRVPIHRAEGSACALVRVHS
jgi:hypothetical protein